MLAPSKLSDGSKTSEREEPGYEKEKLEKATQSVRKAPTNPQAFRSTYRQRPQKTHGVLQKKDLRKRRGQGTKKNNST